MSTKGVSHQYGNVKGARRGHPTRHIGFAWAKGFNRNTLDNHFAKHGKDFGINNKYSYAAHAISFANRVNLRDCISFIDKRGSTYKYNIKTNELAIITNKGVVVSYFKPKEGKAYYDRQIRSIK